MEIRHLTIRLLNIVLCFNNVFMAQMPFKLTRHTVCSSIATSTGNELTLYGYSLNRCVENCSLRSACVVLTYTRVGRKCSLYLSDESFHNFEISEPQNHDSNYYLNQCVLIVRQDINIAEFQSTTPCGTDTANGLDKGSCSITECQPLILEYGTSYGNIRSKGSRLIYICGLPMERHSTTCMGDGTWSGQPNCVNCLQYLLPTIPDDQITASSIYNVVHGTSRARLDIREKCGLSLVGGWVAEVADTDKYIQAMFDEDLTVNGIVIKGRDKRCGFLQYVKTYTVSFSLDQNCLGGFTPILQEDGTERLFEGSSSETEVEVYSFLQNPVQARCIRLHPEAYVSYVALRFDIFGCEEKCSSYLVSGRYGVLDSGITATTWDSHGSFVTIPQRARLDTPATQYKFGGWFVSHKNPVDNRDYIQVRFRTMRHVVSVITQGVDTSLHSTTMSYNGYTETYSVAHSKDCVTFVNVTDPTTNTLKIFTGNDDMNTKVENYLPEEIDALCVRVIPETFNIRKGLRFDLKGCVDHVCPESAVHSIRPNINSSYKLYIVPDTHSYQDAVDVCLEKDGSLVNIDDSDKHRFITKMLLSCVVYAKTSIYLVGPAGTSPMCASITDRGTLDLIRGPDCYKGGVICEHTLSS